jgi:adenylosuccinate lyase
MLKELTRGKRITGEDLIAFVEKLDIGADAKARLIALTPASYIGIAESLVTEL